MPFVVASAAVLAVVLTSLVRCVRADGLGHRQPPATRPDGESGGTW